MIDRRRPGPDGWQVLERTGTVAELHGLAIPEGTALDPGAWFLDAIAPAVVLGSAQPDGDVDRSRAAAAGVDVVRRRSGGGAVLIEPATVTWLDLLLPVGHPRWEADVGRAMHWVGDLWCRALGDLGEDAEVHRGPLRRTRWSSQICFAGLGPGEVVDGEGRKLVGISQRRTRHAARFQTVAYHRGDPAALTELLALADRTAAAEDLRRMTRATGVERAALREALVRQLADVTGLGGRTAGA